MLKKASPKRSRLMEVAISILLFCLMLGAILYGTLHHSGHADAESLKAIRQTVERATVLCYATEGFYPPTVEYLEERYGLQVDHTRYMVRYDVFADNVMPTIEVIARGS